MKGTTLDTGGTAPVMYESILSYIDESSIRVLVSCKMETEQEVCLQLTGGMK